MDNWPNVAIIILNWNGWRDTIECLESINKVEYPNLDLGNGSWGVTSEIRCSELVSKHSMLHSYVQYYRKLL